MRRPARAASLALLARAGLTLAGPRGTLPLVFPAVVYEDAGARQRALAAEVLEVTSAERPALRLAYLRRWGIVGDTNFGTVLSRHRIDLSEAPAS